MPGCSAVILRHIAHGDASRAAALSRVIAEVCVVAGKTLERRWNDTEPAARGPVLLGSRVIAWWPIAVTGIAVTGLRRLPRPMLAVVLVVFTSVGRVVGRLRLTVLGFGTL